MAQWGAIYELTVSIYVHIHMDSTPAYAYTPIYTTCHSTRSGELCKGDPNHQNTH